jgi:hypothetical protein
MGHGGHGVAGHVPEALLVYQEGVDKGIEKGIEKGVERERRNSLVLIYEGRLGPMPAPLREALARLSDPEKMQALFLLFLRGSAEEIATRVLTPDGAAPG